MDTSFSPTSPASDPPVGSPFAELVINVEAALEGTFHYHVPQDMRATLRVGHLVEIEFGSRLAQGLIIRFDNVAPVPETKPIIALVDAEPVLRPWQIELAHWLSVYYLAPLNACVRLMLPPGLTRWADITLDVNPWWDGAGRLTEGQQALIDLLRERGDMRGRQIRRALPKVKWETAANQLVRRNILIKGSVLDTPRMRPRELRTVELIGGPRQIWAAARQLGRANKQADVLTYLGDSADPLPREEDVLAAAQATPAHVAKLVAAGLVRRQAETVVWVTVAPLQEMPAQWQTQLQQLPTATPDIPPNILAQLQARGLVTPITQPATLSLAMPPAQVLDHILALRGATIYHAILTTLSQAAQPVSLTDLYAATNANLNHLRRLARHDLIRFGSMEVWRDPLADRDFVPMQPPLLTNDQARVWGRIKIAMLAGLDDDDVGDEPDENEADGPESADESPAALPFLLHGVTGSGKTEIYMRAIDLALSQGRQAIVLVPEIALTPQTVRRFAARFPGRVAVLHSRLSDGERYDTWRRARQGLFDIVIGPRSALFTPLDNLGVIVLDEEHDNSYKQTPPVPPPYYHARETAIRLSQIVGATVIMGSATPDLVTYHRARAQKYQLLELPRRIMGHRQRISGQADRLHLTSRYTQQGDDPDDALTIPMPPVQIVDLRQELRSGNRTIFSRDLQRAISETLARREQIILFLNRRGTATFINCRDCGLVLNCPRCDIPLTYHRPHMQIVCHHCGRREPIPETCPRCGSTRIKYFGLGTEELQERVQQAWPMARIVRWDRDTTAGKDTHETLLANFINQEADILVGTQMIAKGLDLPLVTLVGVISADVALGLPDYRSGERAFQLLAQVAGRAGRGLLGGRVIVQTYQPEHYAIQAAADHDFVSFYLEEIRFRTQHSLPPFRRLARLVIADPINERAQREATRIAQALRQEAQALALSATEVLGPTPPFFSRIKGRYRWQILLRSPDPTRLLRAVPLSAQWVIDIDPVSTL
ncbi:MAG: primosomal protein N' [Ardenticatenales bacterium]|nr:primosomal protein N' [Ardenticatenales bacterium]